MSDSSSELVQVPAGPVRLEGILSVPLRARGVVLFAHGSGSSRLSRRNNFVARFLRARKFATLLMDLLTPGEDAVYENRFDTELLSERHASATEWLTGREHTKDLPN